jgi:Fur family ferric uptake transcriptional regulator
MTPELVAGPARLLGNSVMAASPGPHSRSTRQKRAVAAVLDNAGGFLSAQELFTHLRSQGENIGLTTVYNQLRSLAGAGEVDAIRSDDGELRYRRCDSSGHHHHLVCRQCGRTIEVEEPAVERWADQVAAAHRFVDVSHTVEIVGRCPSCAGRPQEGPMRSGRGPREVRAGSPGGQARGPRRSGPGPQEVRPGR